MKKILISAVVAVLALAARAEFLYFQATGYSDDFAYAMVGVAKNGEPSWSGAGEKVYLQLWDEDGATGTYRQYVDDGELTATGWADLGAYTTDGSYSFYVETYDASGELLTGYASDWAKTYAQLKEGGYVYDPTSTNPQAPVAWSVPEPSGGLLVLGGLIGLCLRRRMKARVPPGNKERKKT